VAASVELQRACSGKVARFLRSAMLADRSNEETRRGAQERSSDIPRARYAPALA